MSTSETFTIKINDGPPRSFVASTGMYKYAALEAVLTDPALLPLPNEVCAIHVEIWRENLLPDYGPYHFLIWEDARFSGHFYVTGATTKDPTDG